MLITNYFKKMKSDKKQINTKNKEIKKSKKIVQKQSESDFDYPTINSNNYFRIIKELERQNANQKLAEEISKKESKPKQKNINELIYVNNSKKLGNYYNKNQNDLLLFGSSKYDAMSMDNLLKEMGQYKSKVINKINENKNNKNNKTLKKKSSEINEIIDEYDNIKNKVILTPLAENEKERSEMEPLEKKNFDEANRLGVVMRRIEYTNLLKNRKNINKTPENKELILKLKNSVDKIEKSWIKYRYRKNIKMKKENKKGNIEIEIQYLAINDNLKKIDNLEKQNKELNEKINQTNIEIERLDSQNKELQTLIEETNNNKNQEFSEINLKYNEKINELKELNQTYNDVVLEKNTLKENYDKLLEEKNSLTDKYNEIFENLNKEKEELNNTKNEYELILKQNNEKDEKMKELEEQIENINK